MTSAVDPMPDEDDIAARWYARTRSGEMTTPERAEMEAWLAGDPAHQAAFDAVAQAWSALDLVRADPRVLAMRETLPPPRRAVSPMTRRAIAASLAAVVVAGAVSGAVRFWPSRAFADQSFQTGVGQKTTVTLPDRSVVMLNTDTRLRTTRDADRRLVYLDRGQAFFDVAKDPSRPFIVHAGGRTITAVGTAFDVRVGAKGLSVTLVEGKVRVATPVPASRAPGGEPARRGVETTEMVAGSQLVAPDAQRWTVTRTDVVKATGWVRDQLIFQAEPLSDVAAEMNRYSVRKIVIADAGVGRTLVSGNFRPGDVEGFARAVEAYDYARISSNNPDSIELSAPSDE
jgi:transmembrane sensor